MKKPVVIPYIEAAVEHLKIVKDLPWPDNTVEIPMNGMGAIEDELVKLGYEHDPGDGDNTNGWEVDFSYDFKKKGEKTIVVSGSLWQYDNTYTLHFSYEEDTTKEGEKASEEK